MTHCRSTIPANHGSRVQFRQRLTVAGNENENFESYPSQFLQPPVAGVLWRGTPARRGLMQTTHSTFRHGKAVVLSQLEPSCRNFQNCGKFAVEHPDGAVKAYYVKSVDCENMHGLWSVSWLKNASHDETAQRKQRET